MWVYIPSAKVSKLTALTIDLVKRSIIITFIPRPQLLTPRPIILKKKSN